MNDLQQALKFSFFLFITGFFAQPVSANSVIGKWYSLDDTTHKPRVLIEFSRDQEILAAKILHVFPQKGDTGLCSLCPGQFKDQVIQGMTFAGGFKSSSDPNVWSDGHILDPKTGKIYRAKLTLDGDRLLVRGYIGISLIGRTQVWARALDING